MTDGGRSRTSGAGLSAYLKEAFLWRWNLLALLGAGAAAMLSPIPDVLLPLVGAAELFFVAGLTAVPRFRAAVDAKEHAKTSGPLVRDESGAPRQSLGELVAGLDREAQERMARLRRRCLEMRNLAQGVRGQSAGRGDDLNTPSLDRLLWVFLRLLHSQQALQRFLAATEPSEIEEHLSDLKAREVSAREKKDERILRSLTDSIATAELRLGNYHKAAQNSEFVGVELDRIEGKIQALTEMAVSHQDPDFISSQVDSVAASMTQTEAAIRELNVMTGLTDVIDEPPSILESEPPPPPVVVQGRRR